MHSASQISKQRLGKSPAAEFEAYGKQQDKRDANHDDDLHLGCRA